VPHLLYETNSDNKSTRTTVKRIQQGSTKEVLEVLQKYKDCKETHHESGNPELGGHVYTFGVPGQADKYRKTTEAIAEYVGQKMMNQMWALVQKGKEANFPEPKDPGDKPTVAQMEKYKMQLRMSLDKADKYQSEKAKVFRLIIGQCVPAMKHKIEGDTKYPALVEASDVQYTAHPHSQLRVPDGTEP
jgi:hypothetical protein